MGLKNMKKGSVFVPFALLLIFISSHSPVFASGPGTIAIANVHVIDVTKSSARIAWDTSIPTSNKIIYGATTSYGYTANSAGLFSHHVWTITGLSPQATYHFCPLSDDGNGNTAMCDGQKNDYTVIAGATTPVEPELPRAYVDTTMPMVNGQTFTVASDCSDLQDKINAAAAADGNKTHQVIIPAGTTCSGAFHAPLKSGGSGWIIVRTSTPDASLPAPGVRINPAQQPLMATIQSTSWSNAYSTSANRASLEPCAPGQFWSWQISGGGPFDVAKCDPVTLKFASVAYTSGTTVPTNCNTGDWFYKTNEPKYFYRVAWYCFTQNHFVNMTFRDDQGFKSALTADSGSSHYRFLGINFTNLGTASNSYRSMDYNYLVSIDKGADHIVLDRDYIHGQGAPSKVWGGVAMDGSYVAVVDSYLDDLNAWKNINDVDTESRGISVSWGPGPGKISNNFIQALGLNLFFDDEGIASRGQTFADYEIRGNYFHRDDKYRNGFNKVFPVPTSAPQQGPAYDGHYYDVRQLLELKLGRRMLIDGNVFDGNWTSVTQGAALSFGARPGYNPSPPDNIDSQISDITISNNLIENVPTGISIFGLLQPPAPLILQRLKVANNLFLNINGYLDANPGRNYNGYNGQIFDIEAAPEDITIVHNTIYKNTGTNPAFINGGPGTDAPGSGLVVRDNIVTPLNGGYSSSGSDYGAPALSSNWRNIPNASWVFDHNIFSGPFAQAGYNVPSNYPAGNFFPASDTVIGFNNPESGDYSLAGTSIYTNKGSDGTNSGVNMTVLAAATVNAINGGSSSVYIPPVSASPITPPADTQPPTLSSIASSGVAQTTATIAWITDENSDTQVDFGTTTLYGFSSVLNSVLGTHHTVNLINLTAGTVYHYRVKSRDNTGNISISSDQVITTLPVVTITDPTPMASSTLSGWWGNGWLYRKKITIDHNKILSSLTNFPVLISLTDSELKNVGKTNGSDMLIFDSAGNKLSYEIESFDKASGSLVVWVNVPVLSSSSDTLLYLYYGNTAAPDQQNKIAVWDSNFSAVYHLNQDIQSSGVVDSTANGRNMAVNSVSTGIGNALVTLASGKIGNGVNFSTTDQYKGYYATTTGVSGLGNAQTTIAGWVKINNLYASDNNATGIFGNPGGSYPGRFNGIFLNANGQFYYALGREGDIIATSPSVPVGAWHYVAATYDGTLGTFYFDGVSVGTKVPIAPPVGDITSYINYVQNRESSAAYDELEFSSTSRSPQWILTEYNNQLNPSSFISVAAQETYQAPVVNNLQPSNPSAPSGTPTGTGTVTGGSGTGGSISTTPQTPSGETRTLTSPSNPVTGNTPSSFNGIKLINYKGTLYLIQKGQRQGVTNPGMLASYGFTFADAVPATTADLSVPQGSILLPADGSLVKSKEDQTVYVISQGQRHGFTSASVFTSLGYKFSSVLVVTNPELQALSKADNLSDATKAHLPGTDINRNGTVYWLDGNQVLHPYPSVAIYNSWHKDNDFSAVVLANSEDQDLPVGDMVIVRVIE